MTHPEPDGHGRVTYDGIRDSPTVTQEYDTVQITVWVDGVGTSLRLDLEPYAAAELASRLAMSAASAMKHAAQSIVIGSCETCLNTRLVRATHNGRESTDRCPDCGPRYNEVGGGFPAFPRLGGGVR